MAKSNPPNRGGSGPKVTKQGNAGPIIGKMSKVGAGGRTIQPTRDKGPSRPGFVKGAKRSGNK